jgi:predicted transglutaminase-like cysteine proteinase
MSMRYAYALACVVVGAVAAWSCGATAAADDVSPQPSSIAPANSHTFSAGAYSFASEPFGNAVTQIRGSLLEKWNAARAELQIDIDTLAACRAAPDACESIPAKRIIAIVDAAQRREGRARIGEINRAVNLAVAATSDKIQYGMEDKWASPLMTFTSGRGDCEDYVLAKYAALRAAGFAPDDLRFLIVHLPHSKTDHAVLSVRHDGRWLILDNRRFAMLDAVHLDAAPLFALRENDLPFISAAVVNREPYLL